MFPDDSLSALQRFTAISAVGVSALRRQGVGVIHRIREYLAVLDLSDLAEIKNETGFDAWLDRTTEGIVNNRERPEIKWGSARKAINLFLRDALYCKYLSSRYDLEHVEKWLEIPLDSVVAKYLRGEAEKEGRNLPDWNGLRQLLPPESTQFQGYAKRLARIRKMERVHLDIAIWVGNRP